MSKAVNILIEPNDNTGWERIQEIVAIIEHRVNHGEIIVLKMKLTESPDVIEQVRKLEKEEKA